MKDGGDLFYHDCPAAVQKYWHSKLVGHPLRFVLCLLQVISLSSMRMRLTISSSSFAQPCLYDAYNHCPSSYLITTDDHVMNTEYQERMVKAGKFEVVERIFSSHTPWLSNAGDVERFIRRGAGEDL